MKPIYFILLLCLFALFSCKKKTQFERVSALHSGIDFNNQITENDSINPLDVVNIYNGGGVGVGDFNNDGLQDLYFSGNMVPSKLYLNKGDFKFEDITAKADVAGEGRWARGVSVVDINNDGLPDIYVANTIYADSTRRYNFLYINQGAGADGVPKFKDEAAAYGLQAGTESTMASFFDYDNDGDLDMYLTVNNASSTYNPNLFGPQSSRIPHFKTGRLFRNDWDAKLGHGRFVDVSNQAGVTISGFGHSASTVDIDSDGWKDIYVADDFVGNNILYINNHDGTFTERSKEYFKHTSFNSMGQDIVDINNDGLADVIELDMNPEDNYRKKMMLGPNNYQTFLNMDQFGYQYQYVRNTLQLNRGRRIDSAGKAGAPVYSDIGFLAGISQTDWSWTPLVADFNNDGYRDLIVTNGFPRDVSDRDFMTYRQEAYSVASKETVLKQVPEIKIHNYAYINNGDLTFKDVSTDWGLQTPSFSNGAVYADLDNDGALDMVINNVNDKASVYRNTGRDDEDKLNNSHYLQLTFKGDKQNINGLGALVNIYYDHGKQQFYEHNPYRGYLSTDQMIAHFGLGKISTVDSVLISWPNGKKQKLTNVKADQKLKIDIANAGLKVEPQTQPVNSLFTEVSKSAGLDFFSKEASFIDFNIQKLLPHKLSENSPALATGDVNNDGLDDMIIGGSYYYQAQVFLQQANGKFKQRDLIPGGPNTTDNYKDEGMVLFDADGNGTLDLYIASGGYDAAPNNAKYQDRFYLNDGKGNFTLTTNTVSVNYTSKMCVRACDYNKDGKLDIFVSGRVSPWEYPKPVSSTILRNDSQNGLVKFTDVTATAAPMLKNIGLVCDAMFTDFDNDGWPDMIMAGEWMPVTFLKNDHGKFINVTQAAGVAGKLGWWNSIVGGDFRHMGRTDYIVGNVGQNSLMQPSEQYPVYITAKDFDNSGAYSAITSFYLRDKNGQKQEFPAQGRDDMLKQMISMKKKYTNYKSYATATMDDILPADMRKGALRLKANTFQSVYLRNDGAGKFTTIPLPVEAQVSVINGMETGDFDNDGNLDVVMNGNDYGTEASIGRYDAFNGLFLKGDGKGGFKPLTILQSGIYIPANGKALVKLRSANGHLLLAASQNKDRTKVFELKAPVKTIAALPDDAYAVIKYKNGKSQKQEFYYGASYLSQSARFLTINDDMQGVTFFNNKGIQRTIK